MIRALDPEPINAIANDPGVRPWLGGKDPLDLTAVVSNPENVTLLTDCVKGAYVLVKHHPGLYEAHSMALPEARGKPMLTLMREGLRFLFTATDCIEVWTHCPDGNAAASRWADIAGFRQAYRREGAIDLNGEMVGCSYRSYTYTAWVERDPLNKRLGEQFHIEMQTLRSHSHPDDPVHDAWAGATIAGCMAGNVVKACALYSRWASIAGYLPATVLGEHPPTVDIADAVLSISNGQLQILKLSRREASPAETAPQGEAFPQCQSASPQPQPQV
jgi:hypothetical protein